MDKPLPTKVQADVRHFAFYVEEQHIADLQVLASN
jgi:hypothetical protein